MTLAELAEPTGQQTGIEQQARGPLARTLITLRTGPDGLSQREAARRIAVYGDNSLPAAARDSWLTQLAAQLLHPLALLLWLAAGLSIVAGTPALAVAITAVVLINAVFALIQEHQAQRAVQALAEYLPATSTVIRDGRPMLIEALQLVPGDLLVLAEGERVSADGRLLTGSVQLDMSTLTGESAPVERRAGARGEDVNLLSLPDLVFSGTLCTAGEARAIVLGTGAHTELGRIAALTQHVHREASPLERQVRRVAWLIAAVGLGIGLAFLPLGLLAGLSLTSAAVFAIGLLVANVPEGLLPTITLALASGVRTLARRGAVVKKLSAVETLGSTTVICTDKTGTLTQNRMTAVAVWTPAELEQPMPAGHGGPQPARVADERYCIALAATSLTGPAGAEQASSPDPTDLALAQAAISLREQWPARRPGAELIGYRFDPDRMLSSSVRADPSGCSVYVKGAPETILNRCTAIAGGAGEAMPLDAANAGRIRDTLQQLTLRGLRVIALASRQLAGQPADRDDAEQQLTFLGMLALQDPPRPEVADAVARCHLAGLRIHIVTGDSGNTAAHVARQVGIGLGGLQVVEAAELTAMSEDQLDELLASGHEIVFARSAPEAKLRIADALKAAGHVVAMTGDGVNDAPALHRADIGVAMGRSGTEVARQAATLVLTDDNFATVVTAIEAGRQVFDNVRKFILYIFAHSVPEIVPFLVFALSGGAIPLPLTVMQILAIDLGTETLPALALGREAAEPGTMSRPPRKRSEGVITRELLIRAWLFMGCISAVLVMAGFGYVLWRAGWRPGDPVGSHSEWHHAYRQATTATWAGVVSCQVGTAFAARVDRASLREIGLFGNRLLLWGIAFELAFAAAIIWLPPLQAVFGTAPLSWDTLCLIGTYPVLVCGADELRRWRRRARELASDTVHHSLTEGES